MEKYPYILLGSEPIGPIALEALKQAKYPPLAVIDDPKLTTAEQVAIVEQYGPTYLLVVGYGAILRRDLLDTVAGQVLNIHPSLLPEYRGPAPVVQAILDGVSETGVSLMEIDTQMDHGPVIAQEKIALSGHEYPEELYEVLTKKGVQLLLEYVDAYVEDKLELLPQNHIEASFTHFIKKEDGLLNFSLPAEQLERQIRAYHGWPRCWTEYQGKRLIIEKAHIEQDTLRFDLVQPEGGKLMSLDQFCAGKRISPEQLYQALGL